MPAASPLTAIRGEPDWTIVFDLDDESHCVGSPQDQLSDLGPTTYAAIVAELGNVHPDHAQVYDLRRATEDALARALRDLEDQGTPELAALVENLEIVQDDIAEHPSCQCALDLWDASEEELFDSAIAGCEDIRYAVWALFDSDGTPKAEFTNTPTVRELWQALSSRDGWGRVELRWYSELRCLDITFRSSPSTWHATAVLLTERQEALKTRIDTTMYVDSDVACLVVAADQVALEVTVSCWGEDTDDADPNCLARLYAGDFEEALEGVTDKLTDLDTTSRQALISLAPRWTGTLEELLSTATTVAAAA